MANKERWLFAGLALALVIVSVLSLTTGAYGKGVWTTPAGLRVLMVLRLPRLLGALLAGSALAISGALVQSVLHNSLASANIIGINAGAAFFRILAGLLFPASFIATMIGGFFGGLLCAGLVLALLIWRKPSRLTLLLAGMAIGQLFGAGTDLLMTIAPDAIQGYAAFKIGSLASMTLIQSGQAALLILPALIIVCLCKRQLELFSLSETQAQALGLSVHKWMVIFLALAAWLSAAVVSFCGMLGFVGLIVPAALRKRNLSSSAFLGACILLGGFLVLLADWLGRIICMPWELPAGLLLSLCGGPYFLWMLFDRRKRYA